MEAFLSWLSSTIIAIIETTGYAGILFLSAVESANIPVPSEIVVPFGGFLAGEGKFTLLGIVLAATLGNLLGSWISYEVAFWGGRPVLERWGKWVLITRHDLDLADRLFARFGSLIILVGRMLPVVRTFISFPAGVARMPRLKFLSYTFAGSLPWNFVLAYAGLVVGEQWHSLKQYFHTFDWLIGGVIVVGGAWWVWRHVKLLRQEAIGK